MNLVVLILLIVLLVSFLPAWPYSQQWGPYPSGGVGLVLLILLILLLTGRL
jgi:hypothetical protein